MVDAGMQHLFLRTPSCMISNLIIHELMHILGLEHMHDATDRDNFIDINFNNILPINYIYFDKVSATNHSYFGTSYDPGSIMHYRTNDFAIDPSQRTIYGKVTAFIF